MDLNQEALSLWNKGQANEAVAMLFKAIDEEPDKKESYYNLINVLIAAEKFADAKAVLDAVEEKFGAEEAYLYAYGNWHYQQQNFSKALENYQKVFQQKETVLAKEAAAMIGQCYFVLEQPKMAVAYLLEAEAYFPEDKRVLLLIGNSLLQTESFSDAERYFDKVVSIDDTNAEAWFKLALAKRALGQDPDEVKKCLQKAKELDPETFLHYIKQLKEIESFVHETDMT